MPIVNGKKRYMREETESPPAEKLRYTPPASPAPTPVKRYVRGQGPGVASAVSRESPRNFIGSFEFDVRINLIQVTFSKITGIESKIEMESFVEGGNNDYPVVRQKAKQKPDILVFEKGMTDTIAGTLFSILRQGMKLTNILIFVKKKGRIMRILTIDEGLILSKKYGDMDSNTSSILIETLELAHTGLKEIPVP